jgi:GxxExxY protein
VLLKMNVNELTGEVVDGSIKVHSVLGPGLLESAYETCLEYELRKRGLHVVAQLPVPIVYEGVRLDAGYRIDLLVNDTVVVEVKAVTKLVPVHEAQLLSYLKLSGYRVGLLINFHVLLLRDGIRRMVNGL